MSRVVAFHVINLACSYQSLPIYTAYLASITHKAAICDRCIEPIHGRWFRCANCDVDFCEDCEQMGIHDGRHVFLVFKSTLDMPKFR
jgi:hypothetical protein